MPARRPSAPLRDGALGGAAGAASGHVTPRTMLATPGRRCRPTASARGRAGHPVGRAREGVGRLRRRRRRGSGPRHSSPASWIRPTVAVGSVRERRAGGLDRQQSHRRRMKVAGDRAPGLLGRARSRPRSELAAARSSAASTARARRSRRCRRSAQIVRAGRACSRSTVSRCCCCTARCAPTRAFIAGMSPGPDVAELNANLDALGYGHGLTGDAFTAATAAAIRALQAAHGIARPASCCSARSCSSRARSASRA